MRCPHCEHIHKHWEFMAFDEYDTEKGGVKWPVTVEVCDYETEEDAKVAAQSVISRVYWGLRRVWECASCDINRSNADTLRAMAEAMQ